MFKQSVERSDWVFLPQIAQTYFEGTECSVANLV